MNGCGSFYTVDTVDKNQWESLLTQFEDATIYQTWSYGAVRWGESQLSHVVVKQQGELCAAAQARIMAIPGLGRGIAYVPYGPLWRRAGRRRDQKCFHSIVCALRDEYVRKRGLFLRLLPNEWACESTPISAMLNEVGLTRQTAARPYRTFIVDLSLTPDALRKSLDVKWRGHLNRAERNGLNITEGNDDASYETFAQIYREMHARKRFAAFVDIDVMRKVQEDLPEHSKMTILIALSGSEPVGALVCSAIGNTAIYFLGATNNQGRQLEASYALQWAMIGRLQSRGYRWYDLGGTDPDNNPGTHSFKAGLSGKAGRETFFLGQFDGCNSLISSLVVRCGDRFKGAMTKRRMRTVNVAAKTTA